MKLQSIFIGKPVSVDYNGQQVKTGIYKHKVEGPVNVHQLGLEGDQVADLTVHGGIDKAVYLYPSEHYDFWRNQGPDLEAESGAFGENLSTIGLDEQACVGDVYQIGSVKLSVTNPRMPCFKLGIKMGDSRFVKEFMIAEKNGFYLKVLEEGTIQAGDEIHKIGEDGHGLTIAECIQLYTTRKTDRDLLKKAVASPSLPQDWVDHFEVQLLKLGKS